MSSQITRKSCLSTGLPGVPSLPSTAILIRVMPGFTESTSIAQQVRPACSPPPAKSPCADRCRRRRRGHAAHRCADLTEESTIAHSALVPSPLARLRIVDALDETKLPRRPMRRTGCSSPSGRPRRTTVARCPPADCGARHRQDAERPERSEYQHQLQFCTHIGVSPTRRYPKDVLLNEPDTALTISSASPRAPSFPVSPMSAK